MQVLPTFLEKVWPRPRALVTLRGLFLGQIISLMVLCGKFRRFGASELPLRNFGTLEKSLTPLLARAHPDGTNERGAS